MQRNHLQVHDPTHIYHEAFAGARNLIGRNRGIPKSRDICHCVCWLIFMNEIIVSMCKLCVKRNASKFNKLNK